MASDVTSPDTDAYQSLQGDRQGDSYMSLVVNLAEGEVRVVPNSSSKESFRSRATTTSGAIRRSDQDAVYTNVGNKKFQSETNLPDLYENTDLPRAVIQGGSTGKKCIRSFRYRDSYIYMSALPFRLLFSWRPDRSSNIDEYR